MKKITKNILKVTLGLAVAGSLVLGTKGIFLDASSHREAPMISNDPLADNTDLYAFRSPDDTNTVTIIANYVPFELPQGGPNYYSFGENIRYEIHIKNDPATTGDDIKYQFTFTKKNEDPTTFFDIRLGAENNKVSYTCVRITKTDSVTIVTNGYVPPPNIGPKSIEGGAGLKKSSYQFLMDSAITTVSGSGGEKIFCGPVDDPFFVDVAGIFDLGNLRPKGSAVDGLAKFNVHSIAIKIPINKLHRAGKSITDRKNILDSSFVIGVWASASRPQITTLNGDGTATHTGEWVQISRIGMPLTNEAIVPVGYKDKWNATSPYTPDTVVNNYLSNPELALYMDTSKYAGAVPSFEPLRIQSKALGAYNFLYGQDGFFPLKGNKALDNTALADAAFGNVLLKKGHPRSVDILPIFHTGVPNLRPYQLAVNKAGGSPLSEGKPFINNFLPTLGDMLRLNMAVPVTARTSADFSSLGIMYAAYLGLTDGRFNKNQSLQFIPNMDGFPNGRRLEDDVTRIELQAVGGLVMAAIGVPFDKADQLMKEVNFTTGVEQNDVAFRTTFPYEQTPWRGIEHGGIIAALDKGDQGMKLASPANILFVSPNPSNGQSVVSYKTNYDANVKICVINASTGQLVQTLVNEHKEAGMYQINLNSIRGLNIVVLYIDGIVVKTFKVVGE